MFLKNKLGFYITIFFSIIVSIFLTILSLIPHMFFRSLIPNDRFSRRFIGTFIFFFFLLFISLIEIVIRNRAKSIRCDVSRGEMWRNVARCGEMWCRTRQRAWWGQRIGGDTSCEERGAICTVGEQGLRYVGDNGTREGNTRRPIRPVG